MFLVTSGGKRKKTLYLAIWLRPVRKQQKQDCKQDSGTALCIWTNPYNRDQSTADVISSYCNQSQQTTSSKPRQSVWESATRTPSAQTQKFLLQPCTEPRPWALMSIKRVEHTHTIPDYPPYWIPPALKKANTQIIGSTWEGICPPLPAHPTESNWTGLRAAPANIQTVPVVIVSP